jgi:UDP-N-acetylmuramoylalanine--D-glutamate ligase
MTSLSDLKHKQILVLGAGITGLSCVRYLSALGLCFAVNDSRANPFSGSYTEQEFYQDFPTARLHLGEWQNELIATADIILMSPGINTVTSNIAQYISADCRVMGDVELFCQLNQEFCLDKHKKPIEILALTGSNGKSTVVSLLAYLANCLGIKAQLGGNIGQPVLDIFTNEIASTGTSINNHLPEFLILELSSFQLETLTSMQAIATSVLNVSDDHLDRHQTMENYIRIKQSIYQQGKVAIINRDDAATKTPNPSQSTISIGSDAPSDNQFGITVENSKAYLAFGKQNLIALEELPLAGMHNALNYLTALAFGYSAGWSLTKLVDNLAGFTGLAHRCQRIKTQDNITWINDSKATNVGATLAAINGLAQTLTSEGNTKPRLILIAGGDGKGADFSPLSAPLTQYVSQVITLGKDGDSIAEVVIEQANVSKVASLHEAVQVAKAYAKAGDVVLLSPACASLDMFKSFVDRGEQFMAAVTLLTEET